MKELEGIVEYIELMLDDPDRYIGGTAETVESVLFSTFIMWSILLDMDRSTISTLWQEEIKRACEKSKTADKTLFRLSQNVLLDDINPLDRVIKHARNIWNKLKHEDLSVNRPQG